MNKKLVIGLIISSLVVGGFGFTKITNNAASEVEEVSYVYANVEQGDIIIDISSDGQIEIPIREYTFDTNGDVESISVEVGQTVQAGDQLMSLSGDWVENSLYEAELTLQNAYLTKEKNNNTYANNLANYEYQLGQLQNEYEVLKEVYEDTKLLSEIYSVNDIENAKRNYEQALETYENYKVVNKPVSTSEQDAITIQKAQNAVEKLQLELDETTITAVEAGLAINIDATVGENVLSSQVVIYVEENESIYATTQISETDILSIYIDQKVYLEIEAVLGTEYEAKVIDINRNPIIDSNGIVNYEVTLKLNENNVEIMDGMTLVSTFVIMEKLDVLKIPNKAVTKEGTMQIVNVMTGEDTAQQREITTGLTDGKFVEVLDGLDAGDRLVYEK